MVKVVNFNCIIFQEILPDVDELLYVDTDIVFLSPVEELWSYFKKLNSSHLAGMVMNSETPHVGFFVEIAKHPYYSTTGRFCHNFFNF